MLTTSSASSAIMLASGTAKPLPEKTLPDSINWFGWCTWDAFYSKVSAAGVKDGLDTLTAGGIPPRFVIIDDGWQVGYR